MLVNRVKPRALLRSWTLAPLLVLMVLSGLAFSATPAMAEFGLEKFALSARNQNGTPDLQAGSHPYALTNTFVLNSNPGVGGIDGRKRVTEAPLEGYMKDVGLELPPGFVGDPNATPKCSYQQFVKIILTNVNGTSNETNECSNETAVGIATTYLTQPGISEFTPSSDPIYNLVPPTGVAAEFGFIVAGFTPVFLDTGVRTGSDYGLTTTVSDISQAVVLAASKVTIWGVPAAPAHNDVRGTCVSGSLGAAQPYEELSPELKGIDEAPQGLDRGEDEIEGPIGVRLPGQIPVAPVVSDGNCPTQTPVVPLLTNPTSCGAPRTATMSVDSWEEPGNFSGSRTKHASLPELEGCDKLDFSPTLTVTPDKPDASTSSGLTVNVKVPQETTKNPVGLAEADVKDTTVMLPPGVALNPAGANGLEACSSDPGALAAGQLGSPGDGIGFKGFQESKSEPGVSLPTFTSALPGSIAATDAVSTKALEEREDVIQPGLNFCSNASKIGTVRIKTPLLEHELTGTAYLAAQEANPFGSLMAMYVVAEEPVAGVMVKLPGEVSLCKGAGEVIAGQTCQGLGQVVTTLENTPQLPFEEFEAHFFGGEKAPLTTPATCGTYTTQTSFTPWSTPPGGASSSPGGTSSSSVVDPSAQFTITNGPNGGPCPGSSLPFSPSLTGGALNVNAGAFSPFTLTMNRSDGEQNLQSVEAKLPPGLSGILAGVELCPEPQANLGECGPNSLIGETTVSVGVGGDPYTDTGGKFYLTGPYNGTGSCTVGQAGCAPFGIAFNVPAKAGPFDLAHTKSFSPACDCILVRGKIEINPITAAITVTSNPPGTTDSVPTSIEGIPLEIQKINATTTRPGFQFNPTNCSKMEVTGTIHSSEGGTDSIGVPFQVTNCEHLKFEPKISVSTQGHTSRADGASLTYKIAYPNVPQGTDADIRYAKVALPSELPSRLTTLQKACTSKQFDSNPASCPAESVIGHAKAVVPNIPVPLEGPVYFVSNGGEAFPNLVMVLQGYGVTIELVGDTLIKNGVTSTTFNQVPDNPVTSFEINLPEGKYSALAANGNLCKPTVSKTVKKKVKVQVKGRMRTVTRKVKEQVATSLTIPSDYIGQNGAVYNANVPFTVTGCPKAKVAKKKPAKKKAKGKKK
jgi:hypothetical protein